MLENVKYIDKNYLDLDLLYVLEKLRNSNSGNKDTILSKSNIESFYQQLGTNTKEKDFILNIRMYRDFNQFVKAEEMTVNKSNTNYNFRQDENRNVFLKIPIGNRLDNNLILYSTLGGLVLGVLIIFYAVYRKLK